MRGRKKKGKRRRRRRKSKQERSGEPEGKIENPKAFSLAGILHRLTTSGLPNLCYAGHDLELVNHLKRNTYSEKEIGVILWLQKEKTRARPVTNGMQKNILLRFIRLEAETPC